MRRNIAKRWKASPLGWPTTCKSKHWTATPMFSTLLQRFAPPPTVCHRFNHPPNSLLMLPTHGMFASLGCHCQKVCGVVPMHKLNCKWVLLGACIFSFIHSPKVDDPRGKAPVLLDARQTSHVFESAPGQRWTVRARTRNEAGQSPWSASVSAATLSSAQSHAELIDGPFVSSAQGVSRLSWRGREGADAEELVDHFVVEWRRRTEPRWNQLSRKIPFTGWQRPYNVDLDQLAPGHVYEVRVKALDHNMGTAFMSGTVLAQ